MGDQIEGVVWCLSGIIFGSDCGGLLWLGQIKCVPFSLIIAHLEASNNHHWVVQLEPLEVWHHRVTVVGSGICDVATCNWYTH